MRGQRGLTYIGGIVGVVLVAVAIYLFWLALTPVPYVCSMGTVCLNGNSNPPLLISTEEIGGAVSLVGAGLAVWRL